MTLTTVLVPEGLLKDLDRVVKKRGSNRTEEIKRAIRLLADEHRRFSARRIVIPDYVGVKDIQYSFKEWLRKEKNLPCAFDCPHYHVCRADVGCFQRALTNYLFSLKNKEA